MVVAAVAVAVAAADPPQTGSDSIQHGNQKQQAIKSSRQGAVADSRQKQCIVNTNALTAQIHQQRKSITSAGTDASGKLGSEGIPTSRYQTECD